MSDCTDNGEVETLADMGDASKEGAGDSAAPARLEAIRLRDEMECIVLPRRPGVPASDRPPIEIYLGTEPAQYRANRVFCFSIEKVRDPGREVRIHVMSELPGFDRRGWTTGFTNYRFAIPAFGEGHGRAIYNDEDQIYLTDPGKLFDLEMGEAAHLSISDTESSVMLIDCERMAPVWSLTDAQHAWKRKLLRSASKETGLRGDLDPGWNARDEEFEPGKSHLLHYTTLHTQPWRPFPERFVYQKGSYTELWHELEREATLVGFEPFTQDVPSREFENRLAALTDLPRSEMGSGIGVEGEIASTVEALVRKTKSSHLVELQPDLRGDDEQRQGRFGLQSERRVGLLEFLSSLAPDESFDGVVCVDGLEDLPVWDIPWIIDALFAHAEHFVCVAVRTPASPRRRRFLLPPQGTTHSLSWWRSHFESASVRHPGVSWELVSASGRAFDAEATWRSFGGPRPDPTEPVVWTLSDEGPGNRTQVRALADALGWGWESQTPGLTPASRLPLASRGAHLRCLDSVSRKELLEKQVWPDLVIVAGRRMAPVARWIRQQARGRVRVIALGPKAGTPIDSVDLAVTPKGGMLFPHPSRIETERPLVRVDAQALARNRWRETIDAIPGRKVVLLLGSGMERLGLDAASAESLGRLVSESAAGLGASLLVSASRHTPRALFAGCMRGVGKAAFVHHETVDQRETERAWPVLLESGDVFVLAGLGETSLAEICATGRPVFLSPQRRGGNRFWSQVRDAVVQRIVSRAQARPENDRGTTRPQEGLELLCAKMIDRGWVRPRRDIEALRGKLVRRGHARLLRGPIRAGDLEGFTAPPRTEIEFVVARVRALLGTTTPADVQGERDRVADVQTRWKARNSGNTAGASLRKETL